MEEAVQQKEENVLYFSFSYLLFSHSPGMSCVYLRELSLWEIPHWLLVGEVIDLVFLAVGDHKIPCQGDLLTMLARVLAHLFVKQ